MSENRVSDSGIRAWLADNRTVEREAGEASLTMEEAAFLDLRDARARIAWLEDCLRLIADGSPPDEWKWRETTASGHVIRYLGFGKRGDQDSVAEPQPGDAEDAHVHGWAVGRWEAAKLARAALKQEKP